MAASGQVHLSPLARDWLTALPSTQPPHPRPSVFHCTVNLSVHTTQQLLSSTLQILARARCVLLLANSRTRWSLPEDPSGRVPSMQQELNKGHGVFQWCRDVGILRQDKPAAQHQEGPLAQCHRAHFLGP